MKLDLKMKKMKLDLKMKKMNLEYYIGDEKERAEYRKKYNKKLNEYCNYFLEREKDWQIHQLQNELEQNPNFLPIDFYIVDKSDFYHCIESMSWSLSFSKGLEYFKNNFNCDYELAKREKIAYDILLSNRENKILPNKKKFILELNGAFSKIALDKSSKEKIYNIILKHYDVFPNDFDIVSISKLAKCINYSKNIRSYNENNWKNIVQLLGEFNKYYTESKKLIESNKKRKKLDIVNTDFDGYIVHLKANELEELDKVDKNNPAAIENIKYRYKEELKKCNILFDSIASLYDNLDDFKGIDPFIVYDAINKVTSLKKFYDIPFSYLPEIFKNEFKNSKKNNYTTSEILSKFKEIRPEFLEKNRSKQEQLAIEEYINEILKRDKQIDEKNKIRLYEHENKISNMSNEINKTEGKISELEIELKNQKEVLIELKKQLEYEKKYEVKYELKIINEEMMFNRCDNHFEIKNEYINHLNEYDLSAIRWNNVKVSGIDFSITNAELDPQIVYKKDISNCKFKDANLRDLNINYTGVDLRGTDIREEISMPGVEHSIYDENTKFSNEIINYLTNLEKYNYNNKNKSL